MSVSKNKSDTLILLDENQNFYKGNMHCHTNLSDGKLTPSEIKERYKNQGYSFVAYTDHDSVHSHLDLCDTDFIALTGCEISIKEHPDRSTLVDKCMKVCHLNLYAKDPENEYNVYYSTLADKYNSESEKARLVDIYGDHRREYSKDGINQIIKSANDHGFFVCYNHPRWSLENYSHYSEYQNMWGVEVYNTGVDISGIYEYDINVFDDILRTGKRIYASCGDDNHNKFKYDDSFSAFVMVNCKELSYSSVIDSLLAGNFYSSCGPEIYSLYIQNGKVYIKCSDAASITYSTAGRNSDAYRTEDNTPLTHAEFDIAKDDVYFRIDVIDSKGRHANTQAYFIDDIKDFLNV